MDAVLILLAAELAKQGLQAYFSYSALAGKTAEEIEAEYKKQKAIFFASDPNKLVDV